MEEVPGAVFKFTTDDRQYHHVTLMKAGDGHVLEEIGRRKRAHEHDDTGNSGDKSVYTGLGQFPWSRDLPCQATALAVYKQKE